MAATNRRGKPKGEGPMTTALHDAPPASSAGELRLDGETSVRRMGYGTMQLPGLPVAWGPPRDRDEALVDSRVPLEESFGALAELRAEGLVRHLGLSSATEAELDRARRIAQVAAVQNHFNVADRSGDAMLELCDREGIAFVPYFPLARGELAHSSALEAIARAHDATAAQIALAWLLQRSATTLVIPGTASVAHLEENVGAARVRLEQTELEALDRLSAAGA